MNGGDTVVEDSTEARRNWNRVNQVAVRAGFEDSSDAEEIENMTEEQRKQYGDRKREERRQREKLARTMDMNYFLELVDVKVCGSGYRVQIPLRSIPRSIGGNTAE